MLGMTGRRKKVLFGCATAFLIAFGIFWFFWGATIVDAWNKGIIQDLWDRAIHGDKKRNYAGSNMDNLKAQYTAMMLYHESEGGFPESSGWMDAIQRFLKAGDMTEEEAQKKMIYPGFWGQSGKFGYGMNNAASKKYKDDVPKPNETLLIFDSAKTEKNAHGEPKAMLPNPPRDGRNHGVTIDGTVKKL